MHSFFARRRTLAFVLFVTPAIFTACNGSSTLTPYRGVTPSASPSPAASASAIASATPRPTATPTAAPTTTPTSAPTATPTPAPTATPTSAPTATPTAHPSATPTPTATPLAVASASATGTSRVDGSNPADMDINVSTGVTLPSGDVAGLTYFVGSTNATGSAPSATTYFYLSNPGSFSVMGTVVAAAQSVFNDTPAQLVFASDRPTELDFEYNVMNQAQPILAPNSSYRCTIFDGSTLIGSVTSTVNGSIAGGLTNANVSCTGVYPINSYGASGFGHAYVNLPATYNVGDVYTYIISH